jgi:hypothetical protein
MLFTVWSARISGVLSWAQVSSCSSSCGFSVYSEKDGSPAFHHCLSVTNVYRACPSLSVSSWEPGSVPRLGGHLVYPWTTTVAAPVWWPFTDGKAEVERRLCHQATRDGARLWVLIPCSFTSTLFSVLYHWRPHVNPHCGWTHVKIRDYDQKPTKVIGGWWWAPRTGGFFFF